MPEPSSIFADWLRTLTGADGAGAGGETADAWRCLAEAVIALVAELEGEHLPEQWPSRLRAAFSRFETALETLERRLPFPFGLTPPATLPDGALVTLVGAWREIRRLALAGLEARLAARGVAGEPLQTLRELRSMAIEEADRAYLQLASTDRYVGLFTGWMNGMLHAGPPTGAGR